MQIGGAAGFASGNATTRTLNADTASEQTARDGTRANDDVTGIAPSLQDDAVQISPQGYAAAATDGVGAHNDAATPQTDEADEVDQVDETDDVVEVDEVDPADEMDQADEINEADEADQTDQGDDAQGDLAANGETADDANAHPVESLVSGMLGLDRPDLPADPNQAYSVGRWIAVGVTLGGIVSLLV
jgi:hypothetical protein